MATIYKDAEQALVGSIRAEGLSVVVNGAPPATFRLGESFVQSQLINFADLQSSCFISGKFDLLVDLASGGAAVPDIKMARVRDANVAKYGRQLHAYKYALDHPKAGSLRHDRPVEQLGLIVYAPHRFSSFSDGNGRKGALIGDVTWVEIPCDDSAFLRFLHDVVALLDGPTPEPSRDCKWCAYRSISSSQAVEPSYEFQLKRSLQLVRQKKSVLKRAHVKTRR
jgi:hypothetical protein